MMLAAGQKQTMDDAIAADATSVYWSAEANPPAPTPHVLEKVPAAGGTPVILASHLDPVRAIAIDATSVYWTSTSLEGQPLGAVMKLTPK